MLALSAAIALILAAAHLLAAYLESVHLAPRSRWLSFASGVSVSFVFVKLLPYLHQADAMLRMDNQFPVAYVFALGGMVALYGLEIAVRRARRRAPAGHQRRSWSWIFVLHLGAFAAYNAFLGALLVGQRHEPVVQQLLFLMALLLHNVVNDFSLREHHQQEYRHFGRWVLAVSVMAGWSAATVDIVPDIVVYTVIALVAGAIILNVLKEELPADREGRFGAFLMGCVAFTSLWLLSVQLGGGHQGV